MKLFCNFMPTLNMFWRYAKKYTLILYFEQVFCYLRLLYTEENCYELSVPILNYLMCTCVYAYIILRFGIYEFQLLLFCDFSDVFLVIVKETAFMRFSVAAFQVFFTCVSAFMCCSVSGFFYLLLCIAVLAFFLFMAL